MDIVYSSKFKKDFKQYRTDVVVNKELDIVVNLLLEQKPLPAKYKDHALKGNYKGCRDCHLKPNVVLIYEPGKDYIGLTRIGTHNKLELTETATNPIKLHLKELDEN